MTFRRARPSMVVSIVGFGGTLNRIHHELYVKCREFVGRDAISIVAIINSQSVWSAEKRGAYDPPGSDAGKKSKTKPPQPC